MGDFLNLGWEGNFGDNIVIVVHRLPADTSCPLNIESRKEGYLRWSSRGVEASQMHVAAALFRQPRKHRVKEDRNLRLSHLELSLN